MEVRSNYKKIVLIIAIIVFISFIAFSSYSVYKRGASGNASMSIAKFQIKLNNSTNLNQNIVLKNTITANNYSDNIVVPGTNGRFDLVFDLSNVEVSVNFIINFDTSNLPNNLKLYSNSSYTNQITSLNESYIIGDSTTKTISIYWKWNYLTDDASNTNDNLFMNKNITLPVNIVVNQIVGGGN